MFSSLIFLWLIIAPLICVIAGFLSGKIAVARRTGLYIGIIIGLVFAITGIVLGGGHITGGDIAAILVVVAIATLLGLLGAWLATRKHPYYAKKVGP